jgi:outer membrane protein TolC
VSVSGCAGPPRVDPAERIAHELGLGHAIEYRVTGGPDDAAELSGDLLTMEQAVRWGLEHSPEVQQALARTRSALAEARQVRLLPNPILSVVFRFPEGGGNPTIEAGLAAELFSLLRRPGEIRVADMKLRSAGAEALTEALDVVLGVQERFIEVQGLEAELALLERRRKELEGVLEREKSRKSAGEASGLDVLGLKLERAKVDADLLDRRSSLREAQLGLSRIIGMPSGTLQWRVVAWQPEEMDGGDETAWIESALERRPEIQAIRWELASLGEQAELASSPWLDGSEAGVAAERDEGKWSVGPAVSVPIPFLDWGQARTMRAEAHLVEARHKLTQLRRQVIEEVRRAWGVVRDGQKTHALLQDELIPLLQQQQDRFQAMFLAGEVDQARLLLAQQQLQEALVRKIELECRLATAQARLSRAAGGARAAHQDKSTTQKVNERK